VPYAGCQGVKCSFMFTEDMVLQVDKVMDIADRSKTPDHAVKEIAKVRKSKTRNIACKCCTCAVIMT
jgi:hypothetical protein